ncbi:MAG TPA: phenylacetate--CoA ligase family protein, partial [Paracoccaceae bacterium]|nr:phenylacetate--CoA ligase family protein [Paracoccaceae bacterium]
MTKYFDGLETRSADQRDADWATALPLLVAKAQSGSTGMAAHLAGVEASGVVDRAALAKLPVLRKSELGAAQAATPPFGGFTTKPATGFAHIFQSPGPIYEPGERSHDWWRVGRFLHAVGIGSGDIVQNCFSYHLTPAGMI